jgi:hypothetical protein
LEKWFEKDTVHGTGRFGGSGDISVIFSCGGLAGDAAVIASFVLAAYSGSDAPAVDFPVWTGPARTPADPVTIATREQYWLSLQGAPAGP